MSKIKNMVVITMLLSIFILSSCQQEETNVTIASLKGPTGMGMVQVMENHKEEDDPYQFVLSSAPDELVGKIVNKEVDIACVPTNLASVLYNKTGGQIQLVGINTLGVLYVVENGDSVNTISDLKGKTIYVSGKGASPDYVLNYLLAENGLSAEDVDINFSMQHADLAAAVAAKEVDIALLPQPFVTTVQMKNQDARIAIDLNKEWEASTDSGKALHMGAIIVRKDFAENKEKALESFLKEYSESVTWVNENPTDASLLIKEHGILPNEKLAEKAIPNCNITYIEANTVQDVIDEYFQILFESNKTSVGGKLPDENIYYKTK